MLQRGRTQKEKNKNNGAYKNETRQFDESGTVGT